MLNKPKRRITTPQSVLVRIKEKIFLKLGVDQSKLRILVDKYMLSRHQGQMTKKFRQDKSNLISELTSDKMTIKVFFKCLEVLGVTKVKFNITVTTVTGKEVTVDEELKLLTKENHDDEEEDLPHG